MYRTKINRNTRLRYSLIRLEIIGNNIKMDNSQLAPVGEKYSSAFRNIKSYSLKPVSYTHLRATRPY